MNCIIFNRGTKEVVLAGELQSPISYTGYNVVISGVSRGGIDWDVLDWDVTEDAFPSGFIINTEYGQVYNLRQDELTYTSGKAGILKQEVKTLAQNKINAIAPEWKQRNMLALGLTLIKKGEANWTAEETEQAAQMEAFWGIVESIRAKSDLVEEEVLVNPDYDINGSSHWG